MSNSILSAKSAYTIDSKVLRSLIEEKRVREGLSWRALVKKLGLSNGALTHFKNNDRSGLSLVVFLSVVMWLTDNDLPRCLGLMQDLIVKRNV